MEVIRHDLAQSDSIMNDEPDDDDDDDQLTLTEVVIAAAVAEAVDMPLLALLPQLRPAEVAPARVRRLERVEEMVWRRRGGGGGVGCGGSGGWMEEVGWRRWGGGGERWRRRGAVEEEAGWWRGVVRRWEWRAVKSACNHNLSLFKISNTVLDFFCKKFV